MYIYIVYIYILHSLRSIYIYDLTKKPKSILKYYKIRIINVFLVIYIP